MGYEYDHTWFWFLLWYSKKINLMRTCVILFFISLVTLPTFSQSSLFSIRGKVIDSGTKATLKNVSISINGTLSGTVSDSAGTFNIQGQGAAVILNFSLLGYEKKSVKVSEQLKDTLVVELVQKQNNLNEVNISATGVEVVHKSKRYNVLDYEFLWRQYFTDHLCRS